MVPDFPAFHVSGNALNANIHFSHKYHELFKQLKARREIWYTNVSHCNYTCCCINHVNETETKRRAFLSRHLSG